MTSSLLPTDKFEEARELARLKSADKPGVIWFYQAGSNYLALPHKLREQAGVRLIQCFKDGQTVALGLAEAVDEGVGHRCYDIVARGVEIPLDIESRAQLAGDLDALVMGEALARYARNPEAAASGLLVAVPTTRVRHEAAPKLLEALTSAEEWISAHAEGPARPAVLRQIRTAISEASPALAPSMLAAERYYSGVFSNPGWLVCVEVSDPERPESGKRLLKHRLDLRSAVSREGLEYERNNAFGYVLNSPQNVLRALLSDHFGDSVEGDILTRAFCDHFVKEHHRLVERLEEPGIHTGDLRAAVAATWQTCRGEILARIGEKVARRPARAQMTRAELSHRIVATMTLSVGEMDEAASSTVWEAVAEGYRDDSPPDQEQRLSSA